MGRGERGWMGWKLEGWDSFASFGLGRMPFGSLFYHGLGER